MWILSFLVGIHLTLLPIVVFFVFLSLKRKTMLLVERLVVLGECVHAQVCKKTTLTLELSLTNKS